MILKENDGTKIKMTLLRTPISLNDLKLEYEEGQTSRRERKRKKAKCNKTRRCRGTQEEKDPVESSTKATVNDLSNEDEVNLDLQDSISLNALTSKKEDINDVTFKVKTVRKCTLKKPKKITEEFKQWKYNALTIFENSFVYPFIHASNKYKCFVCSNSFLEIKSLKQHMTNAHTFKDLKLELKNKVSNRHLKVDVSCLKCRICSVDLQDLKDLKTHLKEHGKDIDPEFKDSIIPFKLEGDTFDCQICGETYLKLRLLIIHMSKHFNNYSCEVCGSVFVSLNLLKRHLETHQTASYPCQKCDKIFISSAKRSAHMRGVHLKQLPRRCPICPERFNSNYQRTKHLRIVHNSSTGLFRCETCGKEYDLKYHLLLHIKNVHLHERNHGCPICHFRFFSKYSLSRHMVIHTGEKNFKCEVCGKAYARRRNLKEHSKTHDNAETCSVCGKQFGDLAILATHVSSVHGLMG